MKISTRNQWKGEIINITQGIVNSEIQLSLSDSTINTTIITAIITSIITNAAVKSLDLKKGDTVFALVKASEVMLGFGKFEISARNVLCGKVSEVVEGAVNEEVTIDLGGGASVVSIITKTSAKRLGIQVGKEICAIIKASSVMIGKD